ncbi:hypothetical protein HNO88_004405 [Novosphingobium chloroacetimidivorans]|uniref:Uncharacterized protein n=1 Tax=Novosphingobium chloroacetimidivorans TaxID=1428314 RepID=A0A7W7KDY0_9SPHN|nr:hypothetical protein [Novosphingobium chloroacetimidivorans]
MSNVACLSRARDTRRREIVEVFVAALAAVLDVMQDMETTGEAGSMVDCEPLDEAACMRLIMGNALILRPSLSTSEADKRAALPVIQMLKRSFAARRQCAND